MPLCPSCAKELEKDPRDGEAVWKCVQEKCGDFWFILKIPTPDYLIPKSKKKK